MYDYVKNVYEFCKSEPLWALTFFMCGFIIGDTYFVL
jgi:hypothetical protein